MSYLNLSENVFRDIWLAIDWSRSSRVFSTLFHILSRLVFLRLCIADIFASSKFQTLDPFRYFSPALWSLARFLLHCKVSFNWVDIERCNEKSCWGYSYGCQLRPWCIIYMYIAQLPFPSFYYDKFFVPPPISAIALSSLLHRDDYLLLIKRIFIMKQL